MKYRVLLKFLKVLVYIKRLLWQIGAGIYFVLGAIVGGITRTIIYLGLKTELFFRRLGVIQSNEWTTKRDFLQIIVFLMLFLMTLSETKLAGRGDLSYIGQKTVAYTLIGDEEEIATEEVVAPMRPQRATYSWRSGALSVSELTPNNLVAGEQNLGTVVAGGMALKKPIILPGLISSASRLSEVEYQIQPGDSLSSIAYEFNVSIPTIMWNNNLTSRSVLKIGLVLRIPPTTGVMHTIKKGDSLKKIAALYRAQTEDIIKFNHLKENGSDLKIGDRVVVPNGTIRTTPVIARARSIRETVSNRPLPPNSFALPSAAGYVWPTAQHLITQYYGFTHHAIDIGGPWQSPIYATKSGTVIMSQCGWNSGYGCYVILDHGNGIRSLYGHNSQLLVAVGDEVDTGQTIALMGNTGHVRGITGIHSHFEIQINGARVNPLRYVR